MSTERMLGVEADPRALEHFLQARLEPAGAGWRASCPPLSELCQRLAGDGSLPEWRGGWLGEELLRLRTHEEELEAGLTPDLLEPEGALLPLQPARLLLRGMGLAARERDREAQDSLVLAAETALRLDMPGWVRRSLTAAALLEGLDLSLEAWLEQREKQRQWLSVAVHDGPAQELAARSLWGEDVRRQVLAVRRLSCWLRSPLLEGMTLREAVHDLLDGQPFAFELRYRVAAREDEAGPACQTAYRIVQEALENVARHAQARHVIVTLERRAGCWRGSIEDDGRGFESSPGVGLRLLRQRAAVAGGQADWRRRPGGGTVVSFVLGAGC